MLHLVAVVLRLREQIQVEILPPELAVMELHPRLQDLQ
jgi:hypothetical protein